MHSSHSFPAAPDTIRHRVVTKLHFQRAWDRLPVLCPVMFAGVPFIGEGFIRNISRDGCTVECDRIVLQGSYVKLRLWLADGASALAIDLAAVRWVREQYFGLEFLRLTEAERTRLDEFLVHHRR
ncbi:MAG: PilZ domain-containing protein [Nitrospiraceae bacterium]|nr:PilZ domain-containing protein [Nitrospiraceae bacterium]